MFLRTPLWHRKDAILSVQPLIKIPGAYDSNASPALGNGQVDAELRLLYGQGFAWQGQHHFVNLEAGYRKRLEEPADEVRFDATLGLHYTPEWMALLQSYNTFAVGSRAGGPLNLSNSSDYDLNKIQLSAVYSFTPDMSVQAGVFSHVMGENTGVGEGLVLSFWKNF